MANDGASTRNKVLVALGVMFALAIVLMLGGVGMCVGWLAKKGDASGVIAGTQVPRDVRDRLTKSGRLLPGETLVVYYDGSLSLDGSDVCFVTGDRLVCDREGTVAAIALADVIDVSHRNEGLMGDIIVAATSSGDRVKVEVAPANDGMLFLEALRAEVAKKRGFLTPAPSASSR